MKYKIQTASVNGWADIKISDGTGYVADLYATPEEATEEMQEMVNDRFNEASDFRVVTEDTEQDDDLYC